MASHVIEYSCNSLGVTIFRSGIYFAHIQKRHPGSTYCRQQGITRASPHKKQRRNLVKVPEHSLTSSRNAPNHEVVEGQKVSSSPKV